MSDGLPNTPEAGKRSATLQLAADEVFLAADQLASFAGNAARDANKAEAGGDAALAAAYLQAEEEWRFRESCARLGGVVLGLVVKHEAKVRDCLRACEAAEKRKAAKPRAAARQGVA